jgi:hypothetical protein
MSDTQINTTIHIPRLPTLDKIESRIFLFFLNPPQKIFNISKIHRRIKYLDKKKNQTSRCMQHEVSITLSRVVNFLPQI